MEFDQLSERNNGAHSCYVLSCLRLVGLDDVLRDKIQISDAHFRRSPVIARLLSQKTDCSSPHSWSDWNNNSGDLVSRCFYDAADRPATVFPPNSTVRSVQKADVLISASAPQGRHVLADVIKRPRTVHGQAQNAL